MVILDKPRGACPHCGRWIQLKKDGTVRHHGSDKRSDWPYGRGFRCVGSGEKPLET